MNKNEIQHYFDDIAEFIKTEAGIANLDGKVIACTDEKRNGQLISIPKVNDEAVIHNGYAFVRYNGNSEVITFIGISKGLDVPLLMLLSMSIEKMLNTTGTLGKVAEYYKKILTKEYDTEEICSKASEYGIEFAKERRVLIVDVDKVELPMSIEVLTELFVGNKQITVSGVDLNRVLLVIDQESMPEEIAYQIVDTLEADFLIKVKVGIGSLAQTANDILRSYETAQTAILVTGAFDPTKKVCSYDNMGISRLVHGISEQTADYFIEEVLNDEMYESLGEEYKVTIKYFFENSLNVSETSRKMFIHRNTLVYRLDKIEKLTGLDITRFEDATMLKLAMMLRIYLKGDRGNKGD